jgi:hypothetical protein
MGRITGRGRGELLQNARIQARMLETQRSTLVTVKRFSRSETYVRALSPAAIAAVFQRTGSPEIS